MTAAPETSPHTPVMLAEVLAALAPADGRTYLDGTFGAGGYARAILEAADATLWAIDRDAEAVAHGKTLEAEYAGRLTVLEGRFSEMVELLAAHGVSTVDGVVLDLGVSSPQLDDAARGFSFRFDGPLDMRMEQAGPSAADVVNNMDEAALADLIRTLGEERHAKRVARAIVGARRETPITRTLQLADIVRDAVPKGAGRIDPATRTFMALRLHVNNELGELERGLAAAELLLAPGGRLVVVAFHSLEDRRVKTFLKTRSAKTGGGSRHRPAESLARAPSFELTRRRVAKPGRAEIEANPRARSARLRAAKRTTTPAWPLEDAA